MSCWVSAEQQAGAYRRVAHVSAQRTRICGVQGAVAQEQAGMACGSDPQMTSENPLLLSVLSCLRNEEIRIDDPVRSILAPRFSNPLVYSLHTGCVQGTAKLKLRMEDRKSVVESRKVSWGQVDTSFCVYVCGQRMYVFKSWDSKEILVPSTYVWRRRVRIQQRCAQCSASLEKRTIISS